MASIARERRFTIPGYDLTLAAKEWGTEGGAGVLCLHGYLDNANTWDNLIPLLMARQPELKRAHFVCLDFAGHGLSDYRHLQGDYTFDNSVKEARFVVKSLGWKRYAIMGHSMGSHLAFLLAATTEPDRITHLIVMEWFARFVIDAKQEAGILTATVTAPLPHATMRRQTYPSLHSAALARASSSPNMPLSIEAATLLTARTVRSVDPYPSVQFSSDPRLKNAPIAPRSKDLVRELLSRIACPVLALYGKEGLYMDPEKPDEYLEMTKTTVRKLDIVTVPGKHHFHLDDAVESTANAIVAWLARYPMHAPLAVKEQASGPIRRYKL
ncbi:hypothetical protein HKX48_003653 [Thoreauomyces humboldtii]|nr:hypothetical protein HKX48_003653 [Thoreauomyces humboldtii]